MKQSPSERDAKRECWQHHIENWLASCLSQQKYCERENISATSFTWWRLKGLKTKTADTEAVSFMPAVVKKAEQHGHDTSDPIQLVFPNQLKILLPANFSMDTLASLIRMLGAII